MKTTGQRIKELRYALSKEPGKKISQEKMGKYAGVTKAAVSQWEKEITLPERDPLLAMQKSLGISIDWLISGIGEMFLNKNKISEIPQQYKEGNETRYGNLSRTEKYLIALFEELDAERKNHVLSSCVYNLDPAIYAKIKARFHIEETAKT